MELCTSRAITTSNLFPHKLFTSNYFHLPLTTPLRFNRTSFRRNNPGLVYFMNSPLRSASSEESDQEKESSRDSSMDRQAAALEFLENIDIKLASKYAFSALLVDAVALVALWLATAVVGAIDSIPLFPKVMEVVGLSYTLWFSTRYLIFKENREELFAEMEEIKQKVLG